MSESPLQSDAGNDAIVKMLEFSVVIVTRNRAKMLTDAVTKALAVADDDDVYEVVVVDNGSTDGTAKVLADLGTRYPDRLIIANEPKQGIGHARNAGIRAARGRWLLFLDDDAWAPVKLLSGYRRWLNAYPDTWAWGGGAILRYPARLPLCWGPAFDGMLSALDLGHQPRVLTFPQAPYGLNMLLRREVFDRCGLFRGEISFGGDETDLFLRMSQAGLEVRYAPGCTVLHAVEPSRFSLRWLLTASFRSGGYHANLDRLNGGLRVGWEMISAGWLKVLLGRRGCIPIAMTMHFLRLAGYLWANRSVGNDRG